MFCKIMLSLSLLLPAVTYAEEVLVYVVMQDKAYKAVEDDSGKYLPTNEYTPLDDSAYTDEYYKSEKYKQARHANNLLFNIRVGKI